MQRSNGEINFLTYVLITPARNEEQYIHFTLKSMVGQTRPPLRWVIVSDGSKDRTEDIVNEYRSSYGWIELIRMPEHRDRSFAAKVQCFNAGLDAVKNLPYHVLGNLDADLSFGPGYMAYLLGEFAANSRLGVAGTPFVQEGQQYDYRFTNPEHVSGACQLFRRECFEDIGGYRPLKGGGVDWTAVTSARMRGWHTRTFADEQCIHLRPMGTGSSSRLRAIFHHGEKDRYLGGHPVWQVFRSGYQATRPPYVIGGALLLAGYSWACFRGLRAPIPTELVQFHRAEQMRRLHAVLEGHVWKRQLK